MTSQSINIIDLHKKLDDLYIKYKDNEYILSKLNNFMYQILPFTLETFNKTNIEREERKNRLNNEKNDFIEKFLLKNRCSYCSNNELFILYDGVHFIGYSEDDIQHQILSTITSEKSLIPWKFKIKNNIIKKIKELTPLNCIPESATIQFVINNLFPNIFPSRNYVKYFLTIIGDCLLSKNISKIIYLASPNLKELLREISNLTYTYFGISNLTNCFKFKYHEHDYSICRLLHIKNNNNTNNLSNLKEMHWNISKYILDFLSVAAHYSTRYESADKFLEQCTESSLITHSMFLKNNTSDNIVNMFIEKTIHKCTGTSITNKNINFLWKKFITNMNIPNILFYDSLKSILQKKLIYDGTTDTYLDITSSELPLVASFITFWEITIKEDYDNELEIDELNKIFKFYHGKNWSISDDFLIELIKHFYPETYIDDNKYVLNITCSIWDKRSDIIKSLECFKILCKNKKNNSLESINSAYEYYLHNNKYKWIVSKHYFEKVSKEFLKYYIDEHGIINF